MSNQDGLTRRAFIPGAAAMIVPRHVLGGPGYQAPSDTLNIAGVGVAGMGRRYLQNCESERIIALCDVDQAPIVLRVRFSEPSIAASITAQRQEACRNPITAEGVRLGDAALFERYGITDSTVLLEQLVALVLYLCSDTPDFATIRVPLRAGRHRSARVDIEADVVDVGFRIGAALRSATGRTARDDEPGAPTGVRTAPHIRKAHFHLYWYGPRDQPEQKTAKIKWLAPIAVNIDLADIPPTVRQVEPRHTKNA